MAHILINPSLRAASMSMNIFNRAIFAEVIAILESVSQEILSLGNFVPPTEFPRKICRSTL